MKHQNTIGKFLVLCMILCLTACYESQEGCLDVLASNYDVVADNRCEGCCEYPSLVLNLTQENAGEPFRLGDTIINNLNIRTRVLKIVYLISNISLQLDDESAFVNDSLQVALEQDTFFVTNDYTRVSRIKARYEIGELQDMGHISQLNFDLGIDPVLNGIDFLDDQRNDLNTDPDSLRQSDKSYVVQRLFLGVGPELTDTTTVDVTAAEGLRSVAIDLDTFFVAGKDKEIDVTVDYGGWFDDIDFSNTDQSTTPSKLMENLAAGFQ